MSIISFADLACDPDGPEAEAARKWFAEHGPADLQPLPLGYCERERLKDGSARHIIAWYARSLAELQYDFLKHPSFYDYACGVMAFDMASKIRVIATAELLKRFPPHPLPGLDSHFYWKPPPPHMQERASDQRRVSGRKRAHLDAPPEQISGLTGKGGTVKYLNAPAPPPCNRSICGLKFTRRSEPPRTRGLSVAVIEAAEAAIPMQAGPKRPLTWSD